MALPRDALTQAQEVGTVCVYQASSPEAIRKHGQNADLPVDEIIRVADTVIVREDPSQWRSSRRVGPRRRRTRRIREAAAARRLASPRAAHLSRVKKLRQLAHSKLGIGVARSPLRPPALPPVASEQQRAVSPLARRRPRRRRGRRLRAALGQRSFYELDERLLPAVAARRKRPILVAARLNEANPTAPRLYTLPSRRVLLSDYVERELKKGPFVVVAQGRRA